MQERDVERYLQKKIHESHKMLHENSKILVETEFVPKEVDRFVRLMKKKLELVSSLMKDFPDDITYKRNMQREDFEQPFSFYPLLSCVLCQCSFLKKIAERRIVSFKKSVLYYTPAELECEVGRIIRIDTFLSSLKKGFIKFRPYEHKANDYSEVVIDEEFPKARHAFETITEEETFLEFLDCCCKKVDELHHLLYKLRDDIYFDTRFAVLEIKLEGGRISQEFLTWAMNNARNNDKSILDEKYWRELFNKEQADMQEFRSPDGKQPFKKQIFVFADNRRNSIDFYHPFVINLRKARISDPEILRIVARMEIINDVVAHLREDRAKEAVAKQAEAKGAGDNKYGSLPLYIADEKKLTQFIEDLRLCSDTSEICAAVLKLKDNKITAKEKGKKFGTLANVRGVA